MTIRAIACALLISSLTLPGCMPGQFTTVTIYDSPDAFVRLETDQTVDPDNGHTHPVSLSPEHVAALLAGVMYDEPWAKLPIYDDLNQPRRHQALTDSEVALFAPLVASALEKATPEELVTFYHSTTRSGSQRDVTSGGMFVQGDELHIVVANYRSPTHYSADIGVADTMDDRLTPLRALAPQRGRLTFVPREAAVEVTESGMATWFQADKREVIVRYRLVPSRRTGQTPATPTPRP